MSYFFISLINQASFDQLLEKFDLSQRDVAKNYILLFLEISLLESICNLLPKSALTGFTQLYQQQASSVKLLTYLDSYVQTSRLALSELLRRSLFGLQTKLEL